MTLKLSLGDLSDPNMQAQLVVLKLSIYSCAVLNQHLYYSQSTLRRRYMQRCHTLLIHLIHNSTILNQHYSHSRISILSDVVQRGPAILVRSIRISPTSYQKPDDFYV